METQCPGCANRLRLPELKPGAKYRCPSCGTIVAPGADGSLGQQSQIGGGSSLSTSGGAAWQPPPPPAAPPGGYTGSSYTGAPQNPYAYTSAQNQQAHWQNPNAYRPSTGQPYSPVYRKKGGGSVWPVIGVVLAVKFGLLFFGCMCGIGQAIMDPGPSYNDSYEYDYGASAPETYGSDPYGGYPTAPSYDGSEAPDYGGSGYDGSGGYGGAEYGGSGYDGSGYGGPATDGSGFGGAGYDGSGFGTPGGFDQNGYGSPSPPGGLGEPGYGGPSSPGYGPSGGGGPYGGPSSPYGGPPERPEPPGGPDFGPAR